MTEIARPDAAAFVAGFAGGTIAIHHHGRRHHAHGPGRSAARIA
ncbi:MAG: hypothetical protein JWP15_1746 [Alphaproteobacteria bacterium]|nr:hypothetical protein [Alphaproteobacteria bacterium]